jgi:hypothetical protein
VLGLLGEGGMGRVFLGSSPGGWPVAIKVIHAGLAADPAFRARFAHEVATARAVGGFYTAPVVDADTAAERPWLAVAYVAGPSLADAVSAGGPFPPLAVRRLGLGLAEALQAIHAAGVVHRDLKPSNVLLAADGPRVIDFGIARAAEHSSLTGTGTILGSAGYMAPEQVTGGQIGPAADVFALGGVLTFAATGRGPFGEGRTEALVYRVVHAEPVLDGVLGPLRQVAARCLAKDPRHRPDPGQVIAALTAIPAPEPATGENWLPEPVTRLVGLHQAATTAAVAAPPTYVPPPRQTPAQALRRLPGWVLGGVALVVALAVAGLVAAHMLSAKSPAPPVKSARLAAGSPTASPAPPSPSPSPSVSASDPAAVVRDYFAAINSRDCAAAWNLGGDNISAAKGQTYQQFCQGFSTTSHDDLTVDSVAGRTVIVTIVARNTDGSSHTFRGTYVVRNGVIDSATVQAAS